MTKNIHFERLSGTFRKLLDLNVGCELPVEFCYDNGKVRKVFRCVSEEYVADEVDELKRINENEMKRIRAVCKKLGYEFGGTK
jgi:hypothetical protein